MYLAKKSITTMKHNINVLLVLLIICMTLGCKKNTDETVESKNNCRIASATNEDNVSAMYHYNSQGRVTKVSYANGHYDLFSYEGGKLVYRKYNVAEQQISDLRNEYSINTAGYIIKEKRYTTTAAAKPRTYEYAYSPDGYLIEWKEFDEQGKLFTTTTFTVENGNKVKAQQGSTSIIYTFLPDENKAGVFQYYFDDTKPLDRFYGKPNKNLVNIVTIGSEASKYFYEMENGLPKHSKLLHGNGSTLAEINYTYDCNK